MTIKIEARVHRLRDWFARVPEPWLVDVQVTGRHDLDQYVESPSWPEAMQAAYKLISDIDHKLMNEVHTSRASRRAADPLAQSGIVLVADVHTMEPTA